MPAFCSLLLPSYFSKNYAGKIGASLIAPSPTLSLPQRYIAKKDMKTSLTISSSTSIVLSQWNVYTKTSMGYGGCGTGTSLED